MPTPGRRRSPARIATPCLLHGGVPEPQPNDLSAQTHGLREQEIGTPLVIDWHCGQVAFHPARSERVDFVGASQQARYTQQLAETTSARGAQGVSASSQARARGVLRLPRPVGPWLRALDRGRRVDGCLLWSRRQPPGPLATPRLSLLRAAPHPPRHVRAGCAVRATGAEGRVGGAHLLRPAGEERDAAMALVASRDQTGPNSVGRVDGRRTVRG